MKILHLASFEGNLGDNANIESIQAALRRGLGGIEFTRLEMREFHWRQRHFDKDFAALANAHDLVVIGGGNYFEVWVEHSCSGMTVDIPFEILTDIQPPILFYGLGFDPSMGYSESTLAKSRAYFEYLLAAPDRYLVTVRNDGSREELARLHGAMLAERIPEVPDGGFFIATPPQSQPWLPPGVSYLAINLAGDMLELRHPGGQSLTPDQFCDEFAAALTRLAERHPGLALVFVPHIFRDLALIAAVIERLADPLRRRRVYVAPYTHGSGPHEAVFGLYAGAAAALGVRFHANVCPIALGVPTIGLVNYPQIAALYRKLGIPERAVDIRMAGFGERLITATDGVLAHPDFAVGQNRVITEATGQLLDDFLQRLGAWLHPN
jgi:polysaccharide pyruvyl transferase WcaK-like protein